MENFKTKFLKHNNKNIKQPKPQTARKNLQLQERKMPFKQQLTSKQFNLPSYYKNKQPGLPLVFSKILPGFPNFFRILKVHILGSIFSFKLISI